jgi:hypothetical protein
MRRLTALSIAAVVATSAIASQAYAGETVQQEHKMEQDSAYFQQMGNKNSSGSVANADTQSSKSMTNVAQYPFSGSVPVNGGYALPSVRHCHL